MAKFNNQVQLTGRVGKNPEPHFMTDGTLIARIRLYVSAPRSATTVADRDDCFALVAWGEVAKRICAELSRGSRVVIQGHLRNRSFMKDGQTHLRTEVHLSHFQQLGNSATKSTERPGRVPVLKKS